MYLDSMQKGIWNSSGCNDQKSQHSIPGYHSCLFATQPVPIVAQCRANTQSPDGGSCSRKSERFTLTPPKPNRDCTVRGNTLVQIYFEHIVWLNNRYYPCEFRQYHLSSTSTSSTEQGIVIVFTNQLQCISHPIGHLCVVIRETEYMSHWNGTLKKLPFGSGPSIRNRWRTANPVLATAGLALMSGIQPCINPHPFE